MNTLLTEMPPANRRFNPSFTALNRHRLIAEAAFFLAEHRGFAPGRAIDDWLVAEREVNAACGLIEPEPRWDGG